MKAIVVLFKLKLHFITATIIAKVGPAFKSADKTLVCDHSNDLIYFLTLTFGILETKRIKRTHLQV